MSLKLVCFLRRALAVAMLLSLIGRVAAQEYRLKDGPILQHPKDVYLLAFSPDGKTLASQCRDVGIFLWDVESGKLIWKLDDEPDSLYLLGFADPNTLVVGRASFRMKSKKDSLEVWDVAKRQLKRSIKITERRGEWGMSSGSNIVAIAADEKGKPGVDLWDVSTGEKVGHLAHDGYANQYAFTHDSKVIAVATKKSVHVWDLPTQKELVTISVKRPLNNIALRPDGKMLFISGLPGDRIELYEVPKGELQYTSLGHCYDCLAMNGMSCSSDGKLLVTNEGLSLLETSAGKLKCSLNAHYTTNIQALATSLQGNRIATAQPESKEVRLFQIEEKK